LLGAFNRHHEGETVRKAKLHVDPLLPEPLQFHKILDDGRPMAWVDDLVSLAEHKDPLVAHR
jgi:hypothetical protein